MGRPEQVIVCAAIRHKRSGLVIASARHFSPVTVAIIEAFGGEVGDWADADQGFINQFDEFLTREEARPIAVKQGKKPELPQTLFSEDLY